MKNIRELDYNPSLLSLDEGFCEKYKEENNAINKNKGWKEWSEDELWYQLCFAILSAGSPRGWAGKVTHKLRNAGYDYERILENTQANIMEISKILKSVESLNPQYCFNRAGYIINAAKKSTLGIHQKLEECMSDDKETSGIKMRSWLIDMEGIREYGASLFLRQIGYSYDLAIISEVLTNFLGRKGFVIPHNYKETEEILKKWIKHQRCSEYDELKLSIFDLAIQPPDVEHYARGGNWLDK